MKILSGIYKNRIIKAPKSDKTRPTSSKLRESLFNMLQHRIEGANFLDLYAGSGSIGIEALSRGAKSAIFVEKNKVAADCLRNNLFSLKIYPNNLKNREFGKEGAQILESGASDSCLGITATIYQKDVEIALKLLGKQGATFDLIYIDPPYELDVSPILNLIPPVLTKEGLVILEQSKRTNPPSCPLKLIDTRHFGDTTLYFYQ